MTAAVATNTVGTVEICPIKNSDDPSRPCDRGAGLETIHPVDSCRGPINTYHKPKLPCTTEKDLPNKDTKKKPTRGNSLPSETSRKHLLSRNNKIRLLYFFYRFSTGSLVPFLSLYMQFSGWSSDQIGKLQSIRPVVTLLSAPIIGGIADRTGQKKIILMTLFCLSVICRLSVKFAAGNVIALATSLFFTSIFYSPVTSLQDSIVVSSLNAAEKSNFGKLRVWAEFGQGVSSTLMMYAINDDNFGFNLVFLVHGLSSMLTLIFMLICIPPDMPLETPSTTPSKNHKHNQKDSAQLKATWKNCISVVVGDVQILTLFSLVIALGVSLGFMENFCYINIRQLYEKFDQKDVAGRDISLCRVFLTLGGVLSWWFSGPLTKKLGPEKFMCGAICCLPLCFWFYSGIGLDLNHWTKFGFLCAEAMRSGIFAALWSTATIRLNELSPPHMKAMMQTVMESTYRGIGHTSGSFFGGILCHKYGEVSAAFSYAGKSLLSFLCMVGTFFFMSSKQKTH